MVVASGKPVRSSRWEPTWQRLVGSTAVVFLVILAFLVGRARAGDDPGPVRSPQSQQQVAPATPGVDPQSQGVDPFSQPQSGQGFDPGTGATDDFGTAVPDDEGSDDDTQGSVDGSGRRSTHVS